MRSEKTIVKMIAKAKAESEEFGRYAEVMLEEIPDMNFPILRDCFKHSATAREYRDYFEKHKVAKS